MSSFHWTTTRLLWADAASVVQIAYAGKEYHLPNRKGNHVVKRVLLLVTCLFVLMGASDPYGLALREARRLRQEKRYEEASQAYETAIASGLCSTVRGDALFELGMAYQASGMWDQAIEIYELFLAELRRVKENDWDFVRGKWKLAECFFAKKQYGGALQVMVATRGHSINSLCGTGEMEHSYRQVLREAILHEYVGEYEAAVSRYFGVAWHDTPADHLRLLSLYDKAGQLPDLLRLVEEEDQRYAEMMRKYRKGCENGGYCPSEHSGLFRTIHGILEIRDLEEAGDWQALLSILEPESPGGGWQHPDHEVREAARLLARHPSDTLPLLLPNASKRGYYAYALGLTGDSEAVTSLKEEVRKEKNYGEVLTLVNDLLGAGPEGVAALEDLYPSAQENLKWLIDRYRQGTLNDLRLKSSGGYEEFPFPPIPERIRLPNHCVYQAPPVNEYDCTFVREAPGPETIGKTGS